MDATARRAVHMQMVACCVDWKRESGVGDVAIGREAGCSSHTGERIDRRQFVASFLMWR